MRSASRLSTTARRRLLVAVAVAVTIGATVSGSAALAASRGAPPAHAPAPAPKPKPTPTPPASSPSAAVPHPVRVTVDPATTAYLLLDLTTVVCTPNPACVASLPADARLLAKARAAGATVIYSETGTAGSQVLPQVAPLPTEPIVKAHADKFAGTDLNQILQADGIKTLVIVGTAINGAVLYTAFEANLNGYTVVAAEDGLSSSSAFVTHYSLYQLLNEPGFTNPTNTPLKAGAVTLSTGKLITFKAAS